MFKKRILGLRAQSWFSLEQIKEDFGTELGAKIKQEHFNYGNYNNSNTALSIDMAYGANPITLSDISNNADKYALRIYVLGQTEPIADIRQTPNRVGRAIFDIQNILQSQVGPMVNSIDSLNYLSLQTNTRLALAGPSLVDIK